MRPMCDHLEPFGSRSRPSRCRGGRQLVFRVVEGRPRVCSATRIVGVPTNEANWIPMRYWLMKSEPDEFSIDDLEKAPKQSTPWFGVRNYLARNFMRDQMALGDKVFFYHSSCPEPGIAGLAVVASVAYPDATQFDKKSKYYDVKATPATPRWMNVDIQFTQKTRLVTLSELRDCPELAQMPLLMRGNRLSITPVQLVEWNFITRKLMKASA
jgi:predicted RNA-binding protein with PUA-like domain